MSAASEFTAYVATASTNSRNVSFLATKSVSELSSTTAAVLSSFTTTVKDALVEKVAVIGENLKIRRFEKVVAENGCVVSYIHGGGRIGVIVDADTTVVNDAVKEALTNIAMQIAALNPKYVSRDEVSADSSHMRKKFS